MPKLNDTYNVLLAHAAGGDNGSFHQLPDTLSDAARATKPLAQLIIFGMAEERPSADLTR